MASELVWKLTEQKVCDPLRRYKTPLVLLLSVGSFTLYNLSHIINILPLAIDQCEIVKLKSTLFELNVLIWLILITDHYKTVVPEFIHFFAGVSRYSPC